MYNGSGFVISNHRHHHHHSLLYRVFHKKTAPFIFGYNSYNNGAICIKFAANVRQGM